MAFREVSVYQIKEALRRWMKGEGERPIARAVGFDRKTARRYIQAAVELGIERCGNEDQLTDELIGQIVEAVRPHRSDGHGQAWRTLLGEEERIKQWIDQGLTVVKIGVLLQRSGVQVPPRTLARFAVQRCGAAKKSVTVRVDDPPPGIELQVDFGYMGLIADGEKRRKFQALIFTACFSRHVFVWPTFSQTTQEVIAGFEAAWLYFGGVFPVVIPDNMKSIVIEAENCAPRFNDVFLEYAQSRGFYIDAARVATPTDKPRVERTVQYVRNNFFAGEEFVDLADVRRRAEVWCRQIAGMRIHGTTCLRPAEAFRAFEAPLLLCLAGQPFDIPVWSDPKVHRDFHCEVDKAIYSVPHTLVGRTLKVRRDSTTVKFYLSGELVKVHPRKPRGGRSTDPADYPSGKEIYATRDIDKLAKIAAGHGEHIGVYAAQLLGGPLPWTKMRQVYRLLGLVKKWGADRVELACTAALDAEALDVNLVSRMIERAREACAPDKYPGGVVVQGRFARDPSEFETAKRASK